MKQNLVTALVMLAVFLFQLRRNWLPNAEPLAVIISGIMAAAAAWVVLQVVFFLWKKLKR